QLGQRAGGDAGRGLAGAGPFEDVAGVGEAVLLHAGEVGVARTHLGQRRLRLARRRVHLGVPLVAAEPLGVLGLDRDGRAGGATVAAAADQRQLVDLEALPGTAPVAEAAAGQLGLDVLDGDGEPGREALDDDHEPLPVRLARGQVAQHWPDVTGRAVTPE